MGVNWQQVTSLAELGGNVALTLLGGAGIVPVGSAALASGIEASVNPLLFAIQGKAPAPAEIQAGYGALIGALNVVKSQAGLDPAMMAKIEEYLAAAGDGLKAYMTEQAGFNLALFSVNEPMAPATT